MTLPNRLVVEMRLFEESVGGLKREPDGVGADRRCAAHYRNAPKSLDQERLF